MQQTAAVMDMDYVHFHDEVQYTAIPRTLVPDTLYHDPVRILCIVPDTEYPVRRPLGDVSNVIKRSLQQHKALSPLAGDRISFTIQPRKQTLGMYQPQWILVAGATAIWCSVSTAGRTRGKTSTAQRKLGDHDTHPRLP